MNKIFILLAFFTYLPIFCASTTFICPGIETPVAVSLKQAYPTNQIKLKAVPYFTKKMSEKRVTTQPHAPLLNEAGTIIINTGNTTFIDEPTCDITGICYKDFTYQTATVHLLDGAPINVKQVTGYTIVSPDYSTMSKKRKELYIHTFYISFDEWHNKVKNNHLNYNGTYVTFPHSLTNYDPTAEHDETPMRYKIEPPEYIYQWTTSMKEPSLPLISEITLIHTTNPVTGITQEYADVDSQKNHSGTFHLNSGIEHPDQVPFALGQPFIKLIQKPDGFYPACSYRIYNPNQQSSENFTPKTKMNLDSTGYWINFLTQAPQNIQSDQCTASETNNVPIQLKVKYGSGQMTCNMRK